MTRCFWCTDDELYQQYHDEEWGVPLYDERQLFELLLLEGFQAGLSWLTVLKKREHYRKVMFNFDANQLSTMTDAKIAELMQDPGIIRNRLKIQAAKRNAIAWLQLPDPVKHLWSFVGGKPMINRFKDRSEMSVCTDEARAMSKDLQQRGFTFVGPTICYSLMQAAGMVMDHTTDCDRYHELASGEVKKKTAAVKVKGEEKAKPRKTKPDPEPEPSSKRSRRSGAKKL